ncbi:30S ribosomal protein S16 [Candidatus Hodgkinia cicadicola]
MVKIRLVPRSKSYHIVVADARRARDAKTIDILGSMSWVRCARRISINMDALKSWLRVGALPTRAVIKLLTNAGLL